MMIELSIFHVARYIIENVERLTTMKLQKLCYYCQAWTLAWDEIPLFEEDFEAWANGPICRELFNVHKGKFSIPHDFLVQYAAFPFNEIQKENMDIVIKEYSGFDPQYLSDLTHSELPWQEARGGVASGENCDTIIQKESMLIYYQGIITNNEDLEKEKAEKQLEAYEEYVSEHGEEEPLLWSEALKLLGEVDGNL